MLVVSDATPLNVLIRIEAVELLPTLYGRIVIPPAVHRELVHARTPQAVRDWVSFPPDWLEVRGPSRLIPSIKGGGGEREAISLAVEVQADLILADDKEARNAARLMNLHVMGTVGVLGLASAQGLIHLPSALSRLSEVGFFISEDIIAQVLERHQPPSES